MNDFTIKSSEDTFASCPDSCDVCNKKCPMPHIHIYFDEYEPFYGKVMGVCSEGCAIKAMQERIN